MRINILATIFAIAASSWPERAFARFYDLAVANTASAATFSFGDAIIGGIIAIAGIAALLTNAAPRRERAGDRSPAWTRVDVACCAIFVFCCVFPTVLSSAYAIYFIFKLLSHGP